MTFTTDCIVDLIRTANEIGVLRNVEKGRLLDRSVGEIRFMREAVGIPTTGTDTDALIPSGMVPSIGLVDETDVSAALLNAAAMIRDPLSQMLNNAFGKFERDGDGKLNSDEFKTFNEILKPGIDTDEQGKPTIDYSERMEHDGDGLISQDEMNSKGVLMPADLSDPSLKSVLAYLLLKADPLAIEAAALLKNEGDKS
ncbi:hypothetical protein LJR098_004983 [Rhizobium sp. LjRoot98]|uniref:hypothetical protein n=1 Tax=Rhizobium sp. LjRoot98 TaxID=3342345 RepID=UPI003ECE00B8